ncbi:MAG: hypothetical protein WA418_23720 [Bradyrhizobium sp.]
MLLDVSPEFAAQRLTPHQPMQQRVMRPDVKIVIDTEVSVQARKTARNSGFRFSSRYQLRNSVGTLVMSNETSSNIRGALDAAQQRRAHINGARRAASIASFSSFLRTTTYEFARSGARSLKKSASDSKIVSAATDRVEKCDTFVSMIRKNLPSSMSAPREFRTSRDRVISRVCGARHEQC